MQWVYKLLGNRMGTVTSVDGQMRLDSWRLVLPNKILLNNIKTHSSSKEIYSLNIRTICKQPFECIWCEKHGKLL